MTTTTGRSSRLGQTRGRSAGYSLVELMIGVALSTFVAAGIFSSFLFVARSSVGISNYSGMNTESRFGLEIFGRDVRSAQAVLSGFSSTSFTILSPLPDGSLQTISYSYRPDLPSRPLLRQMPDGHEYKVMTGVDDLTFRYYNLQGDFAAVPIEVKQIQLQLKLVRNTIGLENTEKVVSARFILRNKKVSN